jgi:acyl-CoA hydrolase
LDQVTYACAARYYKNYVVTASLDKVIAENIETREQRHTNSCYFTMVVMGKDGRSIPLPHAQGDVPGDQGAKQDTP